MANYKFTIIAFLCAFVLGTSSTYAQTVWEPQTNITGYVSTEFNYFDDLEGYNYNYGVSVSEAGLLISYKATSKFSLKGVFVYRPDFDFDKMLNEAYGQYALSNKLNIKVGRFLLPLSPMNSYYYAPVNTSATLPILVSNHEFFPLNTDGISVNGTVGNDFRFKYDVFAGGYRNSTWMKTGPVGFFGDEVTYLKEIMGNPVSIDPSYNKSYNLAVGGNVGISYKNFVDAGFSVFKPRDEKLPIGVNLPPDALYPGSPATYVVQEVNSVKATYGINAKIQYNNTKVIGEYWFSDLEIDNSTIDLVGSFVELSHRINKFTPYARYESQITDNVDYNRITAGINYKPSFERTLKLEYMLYKHDDSDTNINGLVVAYIFSF
ncbi:hypothetical protein [Gracilimonas mengyeensis]|uniref:Beta-barrel porin-2, OmpL-like. bbp2 n=1 Tax=Gracilimonas mengyeensis TaxID=1302730 RepID=A0A521AYX4_9BACT|nr:hypothetical protein [Gracilimonas mengyeensis]SMO40033.1 hypothetical protein SAMN06265219_101467 [Gracilimonas mengyeensis]